MEISERPNYLKAAFANVYNLSLLGGAAAVSLLTGDYIVGASVADNFSYTEVRNGSILTNPRVFFAMAADGLLFRKIAAVHHKFETPYVAIALTAVPSISGR